MSLENRIEEIVDEFAMFDDWMDKYSYIIEMGKDLPVIDDRYRDEQHLISGCQSRVWLYAEENDGKVLFTADSDAVITKGIVALLIRVMSDATPGDILSADLGFLDTIGLKSHLSPTRANGLVSMIKQMQIYAKVFQLKSSK